MRSTSLLISLLLSLTAFGQPSPINRRAFALSGLATTTPLTPQTVLTNMWYWWVSSDVTNGVTVSNQFLDRIQSRPMNQMDNSKSPTNGQPLGIWFNGSTMVLTNAQSAPGFGNINPPNFGLLIMQPTTQAGSAIVVGQTDRGIGVDTTPDVTYSGQISGGPNPICLYKLNRTIDVGIYLTTTNSTWFTNGIACLTNTTATVDSIDVKAFGWTSSSSGFNHYKGYFTEWGMWTNVSKEAVYGAIASIHKYSTNLYGTNVIGSSGIWP